ncbi:MAG: 50S ribosomal protein L30 [Candidatus Riflebacteria bacterium]|nr:50S ribosomal protein L30 [Candidatus Riflebacteria bacterium]
MAKTLEITLVRGTIGTTDDQFRTVRALGLKRRMQTVRKSAHPSILGMIERVKHLVVVREVEGKQ